MPSLFGYHITGKKFKSSLRHYFGNLKMKKFGIVYFFLMISVCQSAYAKDDPLLLMKAMTSICISSDATGFNWKNKKWMQTNFNAGKRYLISKIGYEKYSDESSKFNNKLFLCNAPRVDLDMSEKNEKFSGFVSACYEIKEFGKESGALIANTCDEFWEKGRLSRISCNKHSPQMFFHPDGSYIKFPWHSDIRANVDSKDSLVLEIGACSSVR